MASINAALAPTSETRRPEEATPGPDTLLPVFPVVYFGGIGDGTTLRTGGRDMR